LRATGSSSTIIALRDMLRNYCIDVCITQWPAGLSDFRSAANFGHRRTFY
jgi:hypothetical protein